MALFEKETDMFTPVRPRISGIPIQPTDIQELTCYKEEGRWHISLAGYIRHKGKQLATEIAAMADELITRISGRRNRFTLKLHTLPFEGARVLELDEICNSPQGGAWYRISHARYKVQRLWICDTSLLVFGDLPPRIFFQFGNKQKNRTAGLATN